MHFYRAVTSDGRQLVINANVCDTKNHAQAGPPGLQRGGKHPRTTALEPDWKRKWHLQRETTMSKGPGAGFYKGLWLAHECGMCGRTGGTESRAREL